MLQVSLDELFPLLAPHLPDVPDATMRLHLAAAASEFLAETYLWREPFDATATQAGVQEYQLFSVAPIESVLWLRADDATLTPTDPRFLDKTVLARSGKPQSFWIKAPDTVVLHPIPDTAYLLTGACALKTSRSSTTIPAWLHETWADALVDGAYWRIASIPGKTWTAMDLAMMRRQRFDRAKANAKTHDLRQIELRVQPVRF
ncbi:MAG: hypothetical protein VBE63_08475 [Lamprobacter sp.]|uniref:hypothetical protein n=1 Tax=Lamprobacter sp. TaxID=3100796 RepID=UPI002B263366|nr:hypothetical protein [Lamprobacter sp.]MEA3639965.1 hypothetical protein [Lamprobacter sp.]